MSRTKNVLVAVGLAVLVAAPAFPAQRVCEAPRDALTAAIQDECHASSSGQEPQAQAQQNQPRRPSTKWWLSDEGRAEFGISDQQSRELEAIFQRMLPTLKANKADLDRQEKALSQLLNEATSHETVVVQAIERVEGARSALSRTRTLMLYRMYRLLSADQRAKVQAYHERKAQEGNGLSTRR